MAMLRDELQLLQETHDTVVAMAARCDECQRRLGYVQQTIDGNGSEGLKTRVTVLERYAKWVWVGLSFMVGLVVNAIIMWMQLEEK